MKFRSRIPLLYLIVTAALTLVGIGLRAVAMFTVFDTEVGYFDASVIIVLMTAVSFVGAILPIVLSFFIPQDTLPTHWHEPRKNIAAIPALVCFMLCGGWTLYQAFLGSFSNRLLSVSGALALLSTLYPLLVLAASIGRPIKNTTLSTIGFLPVFWALISLAETYTDQFTTMNSPIKLGLQFGFLGVMLFTVSELRFRLDKPLPRTALCFHAIAVFFCLTGSIPTLIALAAGILKNPVHTAYALGLIGSGIYAAARLAIYVYDSMTSSESTVGDETEEADVVDETSDSTDVSLS